MATPGQRRRGRGGGIARRILVAAAVLLAAAGCSDDGGRLDRAHDLLRDDSRFGTARAAGESFADVAELLLTEGRSCERSCPGVLQASAYLQLVAVEVLTCTQPGIHDARHAVLEHLADVNDDRGASLPPLPALPDCP